MTKPSSSRSPTPITSSSTAISTSRCWTSASFYTGPYTEKISALLDPTIKTIVHIPSVNSRESLKDKHREAEDIMGHLGEWHGVDPETGFHLLKTASGARSRSRTWSTMMPPSVTAWWPR
jgi:hypothetical protein